MDDIRVRRAGREDALLLGAMQLQRSRELGTGPEAGFLDRFAQAWSAEQDRLPAWIAEVEDQHAGVLMVRLVDELPRPQQPRVRSGWVSMLFVPPALRHRGIARRLLHELVTWARVHEVDVLSADEPEGTDGLLRAAGFRPGPARWTLLVNQ